MKNTLSRALFLTALALPFASVVNAQAPRLSSGERTQLTSVQSKSLQQMRAGTPARAQAFDLQERTKLQHAARDAKGLSSMRAGELSNRDLGLIAIAVGIVILIIIIA